MRYNLKFAEALHKTDIGLDGIIRSLGGIPHDHPETIVWYQNGSISSYEIIGELGQNSIPNKANAVKVEIGDTVTSIGNYAFYSCNELTSITIPNGVTSIGKFAFAYCYELTSITIPDSVMNIGNYVFHSSRGLISVTIKNSLININIDEWAFYACNTIVIFEGKDKATVQGMTNFRWQIGANKIICIDGTL